MAEEHGERLRVVERQHELVEELTLRVRTGRHPELALEHRLTGAGRGSGRLDAFGIIVVVGQRIVACRLRLLE